MDLTLAALGGMDPVKESRDEKSELDSEAPKLKPILVWGGVGIERSQSSESSETVRVVISDELGENFGEGEARAGLQGLSFQVTVRLLAGNFGNFSKGGPLRLTCGRPDECRIEKSSPVWIPGIIINN